MLLVLCADLYISVFVAIYNLYYLSMALRKGFILETRGNTENGEGGNVHLLLVALEVLSDSQVCQTMWKIGHSEANAHACPTSARGFKM